MIQSHQMCNVESLLFINFDSNSDAKEDIL
jgi:hypothetical protein